MPLSQSVGLRLASSAIATTFIAFGVNAILRPDHALTFFEFQPPTAVEEKQMVDSLMAIYGIRDIFMGAAIFAASYFDTFSSGLDLDCHWWCCICRWISLLESWPGRVESLGIRAYGHCDRQLVTRHLRQMTGYMWNKGSTHNSHMIDDCGDSTTYDQFRDMPAHENWVHHWAEWFFACTLYGSWDKTQFKLNAEQFVRI